MTAVDRLGEPSPSVMALVLTHNAPATLQRCLTAIGHQTLLPKGVLVVDNASDPPVDAAVFPPSLPDVRLVRSEVNGGPAGGYALAFSAFLEHDYDFAWVMDDDMLPDPTCLERLWVAGARNPRTCYELPVSYQSDGSFGAWTSWCALLLARPIIEQVGVPKEELFWWAEDTEYLQWRIPQAGYPIRVAGDAVVRHDSVRQGRGVPVWKYYYEARNMLYLHLHVKKQLGRYPRNVSKLIARAILREPEGRLVRLRAILVGLSDGARGRLGLRFPTEPMRERSRSGVPDAPEAGR